MKVLSAKATPLRSPGRSRSPVRGPVIRPILALNRCDRADVFSLTQAPLYGREFVWQPIKFAVLTEFHVGFRLWSANPHTSCGRFSGSYLFLATQMGDQMRMTGFLRKAFCSCNLLALAEPRTPAGPPLPDRYAALRRLTYQASRETSITSQRMRKAAGCSWLEKTTRRWKCLI